MTPYSQDDCREVTASMEPESVVTEDEPEGEPEIWSELDEIVPHYPDDDDDLAAIRAILNRRRDRG